MLVLTRKVGERVLIGDDIVVTILDVRGDGIRVGIEAPRGIRIQRDEVVRAVSEANQEAREGAAGAEDPEALIKKSLGMS
jgi:carbon storage regulator